MKTGKELGQAIRAAIEKKLENGSAKTKAQIAEHFKIKPPSLYTWINTGNIGKDKLFELFRYFSDVVPLEHWGLSELPDYTPTQEFHSNEHFVPLYAWPAWNAVDEISEQVPMRRLICPSDNCSNKTYALIMRDDSMLAAGEHGQLCRDDIIFIDPEKEPCRDDYVMATSSKHQLASIKKLIEQDGRQCLLTSNPTWQDRFILINDEIKLHGVVVAKSRIFV